MCLPIFTRYRRTKPSSPRQPSTVPLTNIPSRGQPNVNDSSPLSQPQPTRIPSTPNPPAPVPLVTVSDPEERNIEETSHPSQSGPTPSSSPAAQTVDPSTSAQQDVPGTRSPADEVEERSAWRTPLNAGNMVLGLAKESADVFPPLKSVLGGLSELAKNIDVSLSFHPS